MKGKKRKKKIKKKERKKERKNPSGHKGLNTQKNHINALN